MVKKSENTEKKKKKSLKPKIDEPIHKDKFKRQTLLQTIFLRNQCLQSISSFVTKLSV